MFYCYILRSHKTGRRYVGSCENLSERIRRHNASDSKATKHGVPWVLLQSAKALPPAPKLHNASGTTRADEVGMNSIRYSRAVAAATGRGFKSHQPDVNR
jgi:hypothetical protein